MIQVTRKDSKESVYYLVRRFNRLFQQSVFLDTEKVGKYFEKTARKSDRRARAILRRERKIAKVKKLKLGR